MKKDIEHVVASTAMFMIAFLLSTTSEQPSAARRRRVTGPSLIWSIGTALSVGALVWTTNVYLEQAAFCARLRMQGPPLTAIGSRLPPPQSPEYIELTALGIEAILLSALVFFAIRAIRRRRRLARKPLSSVRASR